MHIETILERYDVDTARARHVADLALTLFDKSKKLHALPDKLRPLLETAALLHNVGAQSGPSQQHLIGRDIVLDTPLSRLDENERAMVACLVAFHRKKVRPDYEPAFLRLGKKNRQYVLRLAALLRIAYGLDASGTQTTHIRTCKVKQSSMQIELSGAHSIENASRALKQADLWQKLLHAQLRFAHDEAGDNASAAGENAENAAATTQEAPADTDQSDGETTLPGKKAAKAAVRTLSAEDALADMGRRLLRGYFQRFLAREAGVRSGEDIEDVHQMRVNTRHLRAMLQALGEVAPAKQVRYFRKELQVAARALSPVRDSDVLLEHIASSREKLPEEERDSLDVLTSAVQRKRMEARHSMLAYLDSQRYADFKRDFATFVTNHAQGWNTALRVRDRAGSNIWRRYEELRAFEADIAASSGGDIAQYELVKLHEVRIAGKRLRYLLEMYADMLGEEAGRCLKLLKEMQEYLGALQDIDVAKEYIGSLDIAASGQPAAEAYLQSREAEMTDLLGGLPERWHTLLGEAYRRDLAALLVQM
jgi:CHAD domain-containing protein